MPSSASGVPSPSEGTGDADDDGTPDYLDDTDDSTDDDTDDGVFDDDDESSSGGSVGSSGDDENGDNTSNENGTNNGTSGDEDADENGNGTSEGDEGTDRVESSEQYTVIDASLSRYEVTPGEEIEVVVEVANTAGESGEFVLQVRNDGALEKTETFTLPANETTTVRVPYRVTEQGNHTIEANRIVAGTVHAGTADGDDDGPLSGGGMLPVLLVLMLIIAVVSLVGYARYRGRTDV